MTLFGKKKTSEKTKKEAINVKNSNNVFKLQF